MYNFLPLLPLTLCSNSSSCIIPLSINISCYYLCLQCGLLLSDPSQVSSPDRRLLWIQQCARCSSSVSQSTLRIFITELTPFTLKLPLSACLPSLRWSPCMQSPHFPHLWSSGIFGIYLEKCLAHNGHLIMLLSVLMLAKFVPVFQPLHMLFHLPGMLFLLILVRWLLIHQCPHSCRLVRKAFCGHSF